MRAFRRGFSPVSTSPVSLLTLVTQLLITGQVLKRVGTGVAAAALPAVYIVGFAAFWR